MNSDNENRLLSVGVTNRGKPNAGQGQPMPGPQYVSPDADTIVDLVRDACQRLGTHTPAALNPEVRGGLAGFLTFVAERLAKYASEGKTGILPEPHQKRRPRTKLAIGESMS